MSGDVNGDMPQCPLPVPHHVQPPDPGAVVFLQSLDDACLRWSVAEVDTGAVPGTRGARCLVFTREGCIRRV